MYVACPQGCQMLYKNLASVCPNHGKFLEKFFENGNVFGNLDFSTFKFFSIHISSTCFNFSSWTVKKRFVLMGIKIGLNDSF